MKIKVLVICLLIASGLSSQNRYPSYWERIKSCDSSVKSPYKGVGDSILRTAPLFKGKPVYIFTGKYFRFTPNAPLKPVYYRENFPNKYYVLWSVQDSLFLPMIKSQQELFIKQ